MTVILVDPRRPALVPVEAIALLAGEVQYTEEIPVRVPWSLPGARPVFDGDDAPVLLSSDRDHPAVQARLAAGDTVITAPHPQRGERLIDAVALMDKLRTDGPWESEQTHDSLRRYLLEETYELFDAVRGGNADELRDELGDVLLQVLFHARIAEDARQHPFTIDDVADSLLRKLGNRAPGVLAGEQISLERQIAEWDERKASEKPRGSCLDGVPTGQPSLALAQKVLIRVLDAGLPADLIPTALTMIAVTAESDAENTLRSELLEFIDVVRQAERSVAGARRSDETAEELDVAPLESITEEEWRAAWPVPLATEQTEPSEPTPEQIPEPTPELELGDERPVSDVAGPAAPAIEEEFPADERLREEEIAADERLREEEIAADERLREEEIAAEQMPVLSDVDVGSNGQPNSVEPQ